MSDLRTKTSGQRLKPRGSPYVAVLAAGRALGYRRRTATSPGRWILRTASDSGGYRFEVLGVADDLADADGKTVLNYQQALAVALGRHAADPKRISVADALADWARWKCATAGSEKQCQDFESATRRIAAAFPRRTLHSITSREINDWLHKLAEGVDPRARRSTANRRLSILKAALTRAADQAGFQGPRGWVATKKFSKADSFGARMLVLSEQQEAAWIAAARPDVAVLLSALQMTGARLGEIRAANVGDMHGSRLTLSGKNGPRTISLSPDKADWFARLAAGRAAAEPLVRRGDGTRWSEVGHKLPVQKAQAAGLPDATSYCLRHGFITRALTRGVPIAAVAAHCGTSVAMIEGSYAKFQRTDMDGWFA